MNLWILFLLFFFSCNNTSKIDTKNTTKDNIITQITTGHTIKDRIPPPIGYIRENYPSNSFEYYLQNFKILGSQEKVKHYDGSYKYNQNIHEAILDIDVGTSDLQQCADAVMRLRAEYLYKEARYKDIKFNFTNGWKADYQTWRSGNSIVVNGNKSYWKPTEKDHKSRTSFRKYLNQIFAYAGTYSLSQELSKKKLSDITIGDVIIKGGFPGHAVIVVDMAIHPDTREKIILLAQSYMPAQQIHVLKNLNNKNKSPWYPISDMEQTIETPEWQFSTQDIYQF